MLGSLDLRGKILLKIGKIVIQIHTKLARFEEVPKLRIIGGRIANANKIFEIRVHKGILTAIL